MDDDCAAASTGHTHNWVYLSLGFEMCTICRKIRRKPKHSSAHAAAVRPHHPRRFIARLVTVARRRLQQHRRRGGGR